jgi:hypothetical protein
MEVAGDTPWRSVAAPARASARLFPGTPLCPLTQVIAADMPELWMSLRSSRIERAILARAGSGVLCPGYGARGVTVDHHVL